MQRLFRPWYNFKPLYNISSLRRQMDKYLKVILNLIDDALANNSKFRQEGFDDAIIKLLTDEKFDFSNIEVQDEILIFIFGVNKNLIKT